MRTIAPLKIAMPSVITMITSPIPKAYRKKLPTTWSSESVALPMPTTAMKIGSVQLRRRRAVRQPER